MENKIGLGKSKKCCACTTCFNVCPKHIISMVRDEKGFLRPLINEGECVNCGVCLKNCSWLDKNKVFKQSEVFYAAKRKDFKKRMQSQSGGAFSVFAESVIKDKGIVYGVSFEDGSAKYVRIEKIKELKKLKGSKYLQAVLGNIYSCVENDLKRKKYVLFSGTACHVDGLKRYLSFKNIDTTSLITIDIICHGVVSPMMFEKYIEYVEKIRGKKVKQFNFRNKAFGWHGHTVSYKVGSNIYRSKDYAKFFYSSYPLRECCFECRYANLNRISDITIGDCWGIGDHYPNFDDNKGCSLIIPNNEKGSDLFEQNKSEFELIKIDKGQALQPNLSHPTDKPDNYTDFWSDYDKYGFEYVFYKYCEVNPLNDSIVLQKHQVLKRIKNKIGRMLGL